MDAAAASGFLFAVASWGQRNTSPSPPRLSSPCFYSLSRDGDSGTMTTLPAGMTREFLFAVARWDSGILLALAGIGSIVSIHCREMGTAELEQRNSQEAPEQFLFAVARWGQRNLCGGLPPPQRLRCFYSLSRDGDSGTRPTVWYHGPDCPWRVSIRCREMGTAEPLMLLRKDQLPPVGFLFAVARWGQRNLTSIRSPARCGFLFAVARWGQRNGHPHVLGGAVGGQFLFAVARWGQRNRRGTACPGRWSCPSFYSLSRDGDSGTTLRWPTTLPRSCFYSLSRDGDSGTRPPVLLGREMVFLFAVARWGQRNGHPQQALQDSTAVRFYSLSRDGDSGTGTYCTCEATLAAFLFAVARWGQRNPHPVEHEHAAPGGFYSPSRDGDSGTYTTAGAWGYVGHGFYSLSRDGDSGTATEPKATIVVIGFLFAVARWGQRNRHRAEGHDRGHWVSIRCREMGTAEPMLSQASTLLISHVSIRCREMGTAERSPSPSSCSSLASRFYSLSRDGDSGTPTRTSPVRSTRPVSIRCREMGTGNRTARRCVDNSFYTFLFAVARWGQWNPHCTARSAGRLRFLFAVARWGQRNDPVTDLHGQCRCAISIRCREMGTAEQAVAHQPPPARRFYSLSRDGDSGTRPMWCQDGSRQGFLFAVARWGQRNTAAIAATTAFAVAFLFAVARWGQRNPRAQARGDRVRPRVSIRCREMGTAEQSNPLVSARLWLVSIRCREMGTAERFSSRGGRRRRWRFYSLSRDGDSGTGWTPKEGTQLTKTYVSIRCREMGTAEPRRPRSGMRWHASSFYSLSRDGDSGTRGGRPPFGRDCRVSIRCREMGTAELLIIGDGYAARSRFLFAVARWGQRNRARPPSRRRARVSIRCREMGTAEPINVENQDFPNVSFYSLSRDGDSGTASDVTFTPATPSCFYSLSRDGDSGTAGQRLMVAAVGTVSIRCREMGTAERDPDRRR